jgi:P-type Na+/K+ transporter
MTLQYPTKKVDRESQNSNLSLPRPAHTLSYDTLAKEIGGNLDDGLTTEESKTRLDQHGSNELGGGGGVQPLKILARQVANAMTLVCLK